MILYHFTGRDHAQAIEREGITGGAIYFPPHMLRGIGWLTDDPRFEAQNWATNESGFCGDRTEVRFTLDVVNAIRWNAYASRILLADPRDIRAFNLAGGSDGEHWYIARLPIERERIISVDYRK